MKKIRALFSPRDMTQGAPWLNILLFAVPMLIGNFVQQLYSTVDAAVVGKYVGPGALAAVGGTMPVLNFLLSLFVGIATGAGIRVSQYFGAKNRLMLSKAIGSCMTLVFLCALLMMAVALPLIRPLLKLLDTKPEIFEWEASYLTIFFYGILFFLAYNMFSGILRGLGDSFSALLFLMLSAALNVVLDLWFVIRFRLGVPGVALATVIAQGVSSVLCLMKLRSMRDVFDLSRQSLKPDKAMSLDILKLGLPSGITQASFSAAMLMVLRLQNTFSLAFLSANTIVVRVDGFAMLPNFSYGQAMTTFIGQNVGARRLDRVRRGARQGTLIALITSAALTVAILLFGRGIMHIFTDETALIDQGMELMKILALGYIAMSVTQCLSGVMRGAGDTVTPMAISIFVSVFIRVTLAYGLVALSRTADNPVGDPRMIYVSLLATWVTGALLNTALYRMGRWKRRLPEDMRTDTL